MINALATSLSGLNAASKRIEVSAENVANAQSTGAAAGAQVAKEAYQAKQTVQSSQQSGGVRVDIKPKDPATFKAPDSEGNLVDYPNVDLAEEVVTQKMATYDFKANLKAIKAEDEITKSLLDITT